MTMTLPALSLDNGRATVAAIKDALAAAGMPRTSTLAGAEIRGLIGSNMLGSTGFSVAYVKRLAPSDQYRLRFNIVLSGKAAGLEYRTWAEPHEREGEMQMHKPIDQDSLHPQIRKVFESFGLEVVRVRSTGHQMHWDDDLDFDVVTINPF